MKLGMSTLRRGLFFHNSFLNCSILPIYLSFLFVLNTTFFANLSIVFYLCITMEIMITGPIGVKFGMSTWGW